VGESRRRNDFPQRETVHKVRRRNKRKVEWKLKISKFWTHSSEEFSLFRWRIETIIFWVA
jgi:hypothetical protein